VLPAVHSNYLHTVLSIPSMLNASQITELSRDVTWKTVDPTVPNFLVENNRTVPFLKRQGYRFAFYPSLWWLATRHNRHADIEPDFGHSLDPVWMLSRSELRRGLRVTSMLDLLHRESTWHRADGEHMMRTFEAIARLPQVEGPVFAFAHVLSPHQPFTFDRDCRPFIYRPAHSRARRDAAYVQQIECLNRVVLRTVATILRNSDIPPVILLQGDHGSNTPAFDSSRTAGAIPWAAAYERLGAFGAYYLPDGGAKVVGDSVTVVNVLGDVLRYYLGADLPRESDAMYLSTYYAPYTFKHVDFSWLAGSGPAVARRVAPGTE
jgi:hypothetical protein